MKLLNSKLLDSKKFKVTVAIVNGVVIVALVGYLVMSMNVSGKKADIKETENVQTLISEADASMPDIYFALLQGSDFDLGNGVEFHFGYAGEYSGYFDADSSNVTGYTYEVETEDAKTFNLLIYNEDKSKHVEYQMSFDSNGNIILTYPGMEQSLVLKY